MRVGYPLAAVILLVVISVVGAGALDLRVLFGVVIPYAALITFLVGFVWRVVSWARRPVPFHVVTTCGQQKSLPWIKSDKLESPHTTAGVIGRMALEILLFRSLFRNQRAQLRGKKRVIYWGSKYLWLGALAFHWSFFIILFRHVRFFAEPVPSVVAFVHGIDGAFQLGVPTLFVTDLIIVLALTYLFVRRVIYPQMRYISLPSDYFALFLLLGVVISGVLMRSVYRVDVVGVKSLAAGLLTFRPIIPEGVGAIFYVHLFLTSVLIAYFPFSKLMHLAGVFLSPTRNLKNNSRRVRHVNPWNYPVPVHTYEEYEDEFRDAMRGVGLPLEKE